MSVILKNAHYIDWKTLSFTRTHLFIEKGKNGKIHFLDDPEKFPLDAEILDVQGKLVTKAFAVGHHHAYSALSRGMPAPRQTPRNWKGTWRGCEQAWLSVEAMPRDISARSFWLVARTVHFTSLTWSAYFSVR